MNCKYKTGIGIYLAIACVNIQASAANNSYSITETIELTCLPAPMDYLNDYSQSVLAISKRSEITTLTVKIFPFAHPRLIANQRWAECDKKFSEFLVSRNPENWDGNLRREIFRDLDNDGVRIDWTSDVDVVRHVSKWAFHRAHDISTMAIWTIYYPDDKPKRLPALMGVYKWGMTNDDLEDELSHEVLGAQMYKNHSYGSCTSYAVYIETILRSIGIPTRIIFCIPPYDPHDRGQVDRYNHAITDETLAGLAVERLNSSSGFIDHVYNEVYVGGSWVRLNYAHLNQTAFDPDYLGIDVKIGVASGLETARVAESWGLRYFSRPFIKDGSPINPYRLVEISENITGR